MSGTTTHPHHRHNRRALRLGLIVGTALMLIKFLAYFLTGSNAILTDAFESIINVIAGIFALYSVSLSAKPRDKEHPYGHGKIEFFSSGFEGGLIMIAAVSIVIISIEHLLHPVALQQLNWGIALSAFSGMVNYLLGRYLITTGKRTQSVTLSADGKHLLTDTWTSIGLIIGLSAIYFSGLLWIDSVIAICFGLFILVTGYKLTRHALGGLMDEADVATIDEVVRVLHANRRDDWIDIHNLRVLRYGSYLHVDCHMTLPWYRSLEDTHRELKAIEDVIHEAFDSKVEAFIHPDPCKPTACSICKLSACPERKHPFEKEVTWDISTLLPNRRHHIS